MPVPTGVDEAGGRVDEQAQTSERALALETGDEVVGERDALDRRTEQELTRVQDHGVRRADVDELGQVLLGLAHVDHALGVVAKDPEQLVDVEVDRGRLDAVVAQGVNDDPARGEGFFDGPIREDHDVGHSTPYGRSRGPVGSGVARRTEACSNPPSVGAGEISCYSWATRPSRLALC